MPNTQQDRPCADSHTFYLHTLSGLIRSAYAATTVVHNLTDLARLTTAFDTYVHHSTEVQLLDLQVHSLGQTAKPCRYQKTCPTLTCVCLEELSITEQWLSSGMALDS